MDKLTTDDLNNLIAFLNRTRLDGREADTLVELKQKIAIELNQRAEAAAKSAIVEGEGQ